MREAVVEPGLDRHEWETEYEALEESLRDDPIEALPELYALVERMLVGRGYAVDDFVADDGVDPELREQYRSAREIARQVDSADTIDPGDVANAINGLTVIYEHLLTERSAP